MKAFILNSIFAIAVVLLILCQLITFVPGAERDFYIFLCLLFLIPSILSRGKIIRIIAIILLIISIFGVYSGHKRGVEYKKFLENRSIDKYLQ